jgi:WD40 repeat protein
VNVKRKHLFRSEETRLTEKAREDSSERLFDRASDLSWRTIVFSALLVIAAAIAVAAVVVAFRRSDEARAAERLATSRALALAAIANSDTAPDLAMLLALEAYRLVRGDSPDRSYEARHSLLLALERNQRLHAVLHGHSGVHGDKRGAAAVAFSPDSKTLATAAENGTIRFWDIASGTEVGKRLVKAFGCGWFGVDLAFDSAGKTLTQISGCAQARVFDVDRRVVLKDLDLIGQDDPEGVALAPDGKTAAVTGEFGGLRLWNLTRGKPLPGGPQPRSNSLLIPLAFTRDGRILATVSSDSKTRLWDAARGATIRRPLHVTSDAAFSFDGQMLALANNDGTIGVWDVAGGGPRGAPLRGLRSPAREIQFDPTGKTLAAASDDGVIAIWNMPTGARAPQTTLRHEGVVSMRFSPDGRRLATAGLDGTVKLWNVFDPLPLADLAQRGDSFEVAISPDGRTLAVEHGYAGGLRCPA